MTCKSMCESQFACVMDYPPWFGGNGSTAQRQTSLLYSGQFQPWSQTLLSESIEQPTLLQLGQLQPLNPTNDKMTALATSSQLCDSDGGVVSVEAPESFSERSLLTL